MSLSKNLICLGAVAGLAWLGRAGTTTNGFWFSGPEIFPINNGISLLHVADLNGDGLNDLIMANNARSKIELLYNQTGSTNRAPAPVVTGEDDVNELPPDARFRIDSIASEKRISALTVADLNGDGRPDIAYYGEPKELIVVYNEGTNNWSAPKRFPIDDGQLNPDALVAADLNGDHRTDLVLLGDTCIYLLAQKADHTLDEPKKIPFSGNVKSIQVLDIDGDGRNDLLLVNWDSPAPFRFRLQDDTGQLGPEYYFTMPPIRSYCADNLEKKNKKTYVVTVAQNSGRAQIADFTRKPAEPLSGTFREGQFQVLPITRTDRARRGEVWADVNGDGLPDLLVAEPDSGQITVYQQRPDGTLASGKTFPTLAGVTDLAVADWNGTGRPEIFILSADERQVGVTHLDPQGRLPFPTLIPVDGKPLVLAVGRLRPGARPTLAVIVDKDGKRSLVTCTADGKSHTQKLSESFTSNPSEMAIQDVNQDGLPDLVVLIPYEKIKVLLGVKGSEDFREVDVAPPGGVIEQPWLSSVDVDGDGKPELLLPQKNFVRAVLLKQGPPLEGSTNVSDWTFVVKDQINGASSDSRIVGAAAIPNGQSKTPSLFLLDAERKTLTLCERDKTGVWQVVHEISLPVSSFNRLQPVALGGHQPNAVGFLGTSGVAWLPLFGDDWQFTPLDSYETPIKDGYLRDVVPGDLNSDGRKDLVFLETAKHYLDLVIFDAEHKLVPANRWPVFEEHTFRGLRSDIPEPREALVSDLTGDGKNDLAIIVHDRVLVYPQE